MFLSHRQRHPQSWEQTRAKGKLRFVGYTSIQWGLPLIVGLPVMYFFLNITLRQMLLLMISYLVVLPLAALVEWWKNEGSYLAAKLDKRGDSLKEN